MRYHPMLKNFITFLGVQIWK